MKKIVGLILSVLTISVSAQSKQDKVVLVIHGGAGTILKKHMTAEKEKAYREALTESLTKGFEVIKKGGESQEAVIEAIKVMEDSPLFNAGKGAVFTHEGKNEMDASLMLGHTMQAGAVAGVTTIKNPITAAKTVLRNSAHVMMVGKGAEEFAQKQGLELVDPSYFKTEERWNSLQKVIEKDKDKMELDHDAKTQAYVPFNFVDEKFGTVGAVALDQKGHIAAGTSTGGMTNKRFGRVGDSPIIGAGTYANSEVGISSTGWGEYFIKAVAAYDVAALMEYKKLSSKQAGDKVIKKIGQLGGDGGMIILDKNGQASFPFNTAGMYRGSITQSGKITIEIYQ
ncbi:isoaspartyl peptidase/L-asparaginase [Empedobacter stercoris]|uniref:Isoaspartyl peptidase/L-asparaginase n=1 Tax=Empedobacter stercoris TaxID=1628248 RepID=A0ABX1WI08_9FLAO|nr:isoaspartyl peptidase/L-asparaginase [Empedobacter stercoris]MCA4777520.1 isoaspartyl peptidase/L-asparaginase [Empedobacter stercoris]MCA4808259.1 isoaspartyl peptidase/L-asparaginase [Empedobacter stercoris]NOJ74303.1 isoaspartyl peptidase/L-asparaginase [Empedobacter stercoris]QNT14401.1 isoaspartyl peptidase/L-asparaginase [Empedobacter stercoris]